MNPIRLEDLIYIHDQIIEQTGGLLGIRDSHTLESALARPYQTGHGQEIFGDLFEKAAAILEALANNHGFVDGNKRTAMAAAALFLYLHNVELGITNKDYEEFMLHVVNNHPSIGEIKTWLMSRSDIG